MLKERKTKMKTSRLTKKLLTNNYGFQPDIATSTICNIKALNKLGQLEDIEEELGIDLITKDKIEKATSVFYKNKYSNKIELYRIESFERKGVNVYISCMLSELNVKTFYLPYEDYGKTWALTKEELEQ